MDSRVRGNDEKGGGDDGEARGLLRMTRCWGMMGESGDGIALPQEASESIMGERHLGGFALNPTEVAHRVVDIASDLQAEDIVLLDIRGQAIFADYFVIMTAGTGRQARALRDDMVKRLKLAGVILNNREGGRGDSGWVLLDFGDVIVHIFGAEQREYYRLEELWSKAPQVVRIQ